MILNVDRLGISFGNATPVRDVRLEVAASEAVGVVGESGSGKSLTALAIMGLLPSHARIEGRILWKGRDLLTLTETERRAIRGREIAMIFQDPMSSLNPSYTIGYQIDEVLKLRLGVRHSKERKRRGIDLLREVGIPAAEERWESYPHQMSGGMSQRVCIAMALAAEPELLIADEPTTALDVTVQMQILDLLSRLKVQRKMAMMFVTHDLAVAAHVCDDIAVFYAGETVERGRASTLLTAPRHPYTEALLKSRPRHDDPARTRLESISGAVPRSTERIAGCSFAMRCAKVLERCPLEKPEARSLDESGQQKQAFARCFLVSSDQIGV